MFKVHRRLIFVLFYRLFEDSKIYRIDRAISTVDPKDVKHHSNLKNTWWDENGRIEPLHSFNPLRVQFVRDGLVNAGIKLCNPALPLEGVKIADIGCGGGILTESLARIGAHVTGLDASAELINVAKEHIKLDPTILERVNYIQTSIEEFSPKNERLYDVVVASEIIEHVENPEIFLKVNFMIKTTIITYKYEQIILIKILYRNV